MRLAPVIVSLFSAIGLASPASAGPARFPATPSDLPLRFEENRGQGPAEALFVARGAEGTVALTRDGALIFLAAEGAAGSATLRLRLVGVDPAPSPAGREPLPGVSHSYRGADPARWVSGVRAFGRVAYPGVYPGIDLLFYGRGRQLEHDFVVSAGADAGAIRLAFEGADAIGLEPGGDLAVRVGRATVRFRRPVAYQEIGGVRRGVEAAFARRDDGTIGFRVGAYDAHAALVIDPVLDYASYLAGVGNDSADCLLLDGKGGLFVAGQTASYDFPPVGGIPQLNNSGVYRREMGESRWTPSWQGLDDPNIVALAVDPLAPDTVYAGTLDGGVYRSDDGGGTWQAASDGIWYQYDRTAYTIAVDPQVPGVVYAGTREGVFTSVDRGETWHASSQGLTSLQCPLSCYKVRRLVLDPLNPGTLYAAARDGIFVSTDGAASWRALLSTGQLLLSLAVSDGGARLILAGTDHGSVRRSADGGATWTETTNGLAYNSVQALAIQPGASDIVFAAIASNGMFRSTDGGLSFAPLPEAPQATVLTFLPGDPTTLYAGGESGVHLSTDRGETWSSLSDGLLDQRVSTLVVHGGDTPAWLAGTNGEGIGDVFVLKLDAETMQPIFATHFGGSGSEGGAQIALDSAGNIVVGGTTTSADFPVTPGAFQTARSGPSDAFVVKLAPDGSLSRSTFLGGTGGERRVGAALSPDDGVVVAGTTDGGFPVTPGAFSDDQGPGQAGFVAKLDNGLGSLAFGTYLGVSGPNWTAGLSGLAVDRAGRICVSGQGGPGYPTTSDAYLPEKPSCCASVFTVLDPAGSHLVYSTFVPAWSMTKVHSSAEGATWAVGGLTPGSDGFVFEWPGQSGHGVFHPIDLGFYHMENAVATGGDGAVYIAGEAGKFVDDGSTIDAYLARWDGSRWSRFLIQGDDSDSANALAIAADGTVYVALRTVSMDLPVTPGGAGWSWGSDGYLVRYRLPWSLPLRIGTAGLPPGETGRPYEARIDTDGGEWPLTVTLASGSLPRGLQLSADGRLSGAPWAKGKSSFEIRVTDDVGVTASRSYQVEVIPGLSIKTTSVPKGKVGKKYSASLKAKGGKAPLTWSVVGAPLPDGLVLSAGTGKISGTPRWAGTSQVQLQVTDAANYSRIHTYSFVIRP